MSRPQIRQGVLNVLMPGRPVSYSEIAAVAYAGHTLPAEYTASLRCVMQRLRECGCAIRALGDGRFVMDPEQAARRQGSLAERSRAALGRLRANAARHAR